MMGYKVFNSDWTCHGKQYSCPGVFEQEGKLELCKNGIHFCKELLKCFDYYNFEGCGIHVAEVEAIGEIIEDERKCCTNKLKIIRELTWEEILKRVNIGDNCKGRGNTGSCNDGDYNAGIGNVGDLNSGDHNIGSMNSGEDNCGNKNSGVRNIGSMNSGKDNYGNRNSGNANDGSFNTGDYNWGRGNSGNWNIGDYNTGNWNMTNYSTGYFNTTPDEIRIFNKPTKMTREEWISSDAYAVFSQMPVVIENRQIWWKIISQAQKNAILSIPNFDAKIFKEITGIDVREDD